MNENEIEGAARTLHGKVEDAVGALTGDAKLQAQGKVRQMAGKVQDNYGATADTVANAAAEIAGAVKAQPLIALVVAGAIGYLLGTLRR